MIARIQLKVSKSRAGPKVSKPKSAGGSSREEQFLRLWKLLANCLDKAPTRQFKFDPKRNWRFDFAWEKEQVAVEIDGGLFQKKASGHRSVNGVMRDMEKLNAAQAAGWCVLRFHANDLDKRPKQTIDLVKLVLWKRSKKSAE